MSRAILIAGPTASGKSDLALALAERTGGVIVNADSQQVYAEWRLLSARPGPAEEARAPHRLYGHVRLASDYSVGRWLRDVAPILREAQEDRRQVIVAGGTGLYFRALTRGLAPIPPISRSLRARGAKELERLGLAAFAKAFAARDPETALGMDLRNPRRVLRAWEVLEGTGRGLAAWRVATPPPLVPLRAARAAVLVPPRSWLYARCEARFDRMIAEGVLDEVRAIAGASGGGAPSDLKAVGARELVAHLAGRLTLDEAVRRAKTETRRYAKRQLAWIRNQMSDWPVLDPSRGHCADRFPDPAP